MSFYLGNTEDGLIVYDVSSLFEGSNKVYAMFDEGTHDLDSVEFLIANQKLTLYVLTPLEETRFTEEDFTVPIEWDCKLRSR